MQNDYGERPGLFTSVVFYRRQEFALPFYDQQRVILTTFRLYMKHHETLSFLPYSFPFDLGYKGCARMESFICRG